MSDTPQRIQRKRTKGWRMPENTVYVGRGTRWGNPYRVGKTQVRLPGIHGQDWEHEGRGSKRSGEKHYFVHPDNSVTWHWVQDATPQQCVELYREYLSGSPYRDTCTTHHWPKYQASMQRTIRAELAGKNLACWCPLDQPCHADVLLEIANKETPNDAEDLEEAVLTPEITITPARLNGLPCIAGTRIDVHTIVQHYDNNMDALTTWYPVTREQVLIALWYCGTHHRKYRWLKEWAKTNHSKLWAGKYDEIKDPTR